MTTTPATIVHELLLERGPLEDAALLFDARRAGAHLNSESLSELLHDDDEMPLAVCLPDGRHAMRDGLLDGRVLTHRLTSSEVENDALYLDPDLLPIGPLVDEAAAMVALAGGPLEWGDEVGGERYERLQSAGIAPEDVIALPSGTLAGYRPDTVVGLRMTREGALLETVDPADPPADLAERIESLLRRPTGDHLEADAPAAREDQHPASRINFADPRPIRPVHHEVDPRGTAELGTPDEATDFGVMPLPLHQLCLALCAQDPTMFTAPLEPLGELLLAAGFAIEDGDVAPAGFDFGPWEFSKSVAQMAATYRIDPEGAFAVATISTVVDELVQATLTVIDQEEGEADPAQPSEISPPAPSDELQMMLRDPEAIAALTTALRDPDVAEALVSAVLDVDHASAAALSALVDVWQPAAPRGARAILRWIHARCEESLGRVETAESDLQAAHDLDPRWPLILEDLARYADDRGDATRAISLLQRAGVSSDDPELSFLQGLRSPERHDIGRNQPCWCGSGRKYKVCHIGKEQLPIEQRAAWLYRKAARFADSPPYRPEKMVLAQLRAAHDMGEMPLLRALRDPLVTDALLFENDVFEEFLDERGHLLPEDERLLGEQWLRERRSVFVVEEVRTGEGLRVRDVRSGNESDVSEVAASRVLQRGQMFVGRVVSVGDTRQIFGGVEPLPMSMEQSALRFCDALEDGDADAEDLVSFLTARFAPPTLQTTDGEPMVSCTAEFRAEDDAGLRAELDERYDGDGHGHWVRSDGRGKHPTILGSLELSGDTLTATAMNERRFEAMLAELDEIGGLSLLRTDRVPAAGLLEQAAGAAEKGPSRADGGGLDLAENPEVRAAVEEYTRQYEQEWLEMPLPALGGASPRAAADDPTRRGQLIRLLDSFEGGDDADDPAVMKPARLRAALGL